MMFAHFSTACRGRGRRTFLVCTTPDLAALVSGRARTSAIRRRSVHAPSPGLS